MEFEKLDMICPGFIVGSKEFSWELFCCIKAYKRNFIFSSTKTHEYVVKYALVCVSLTENKIKLKTRGKGKSSVKLP